MPSNHIAIGVQAVMPTSNGCAIFLGNDNKTFVIYVDQNIGATLNMAINEEKKERPLTHDLINHIFTGFEIQLDKVIINHVNEGTYFARLQLFMSNELGKKLIEIDARPSDSLILALQQKRPIYVTQEVFDEVEDMSEVLDKILKE